MIRGPKGGGDLRLRTALIPVLSFGFVFVWIEQGCLVKHIGCCRSPHNGLVVIMGWLFAASSPTECHHCFIQHCIILGSGFHADTCSPCVQGAGCSRLTVALPPAHAGTDGKVDVGKTSVPPTQAPPPPAPRSGAGVCSLDNCLGIANCLFQV